MKNTSDTLVAFLITLAIVLGTIYGDKLLGLNNFSIEAAILFFVIRILLKVKA